MGKLSGEFRKPNRKDKVTRFPSVTYARQLGLLVNTLGSHLNAVCCDLFEKHDAKLIGVGKLTVLWNLG